MKTTPLDIAQLADNARSSSHEIRREAAIALRQFELDADDALQILEELLQDDAPDVRCEAARSVGKYASHAKDVVPKLTVALSDTEPTVRQEAATTLGRIGPQAHDAVPALIDAVQDDQTRAFAIRALGSIGPSAAPAVPALVQSLEDADANTRNDAIIAIMKMGPAAKPAIEGLARLLKHDDKLTRQRAVMAIGKIGPAAVEAVPALLEVLQQDSVARDAAAEALNGIDRADLAMLPTIQQVLKSKEKSVRIVAVHLIRQLGRDAVTAVPDLVRLLRADATDDEVRSVAAALKRIGPGSIPHLSAALRDEDARLRATAACTLAVLGDGAGEAVPALIESLKDPVPRVRASAVMTLGKIGPDARGAIPPIVELFNDSDPLVRQHAAWALGDIGTEADGSVRELLRLLSDSSDAVRRSAISSLGEIHSHADLVVPELLRIAETLDADGTNRPVGAAVLLALGRFGVEAKPAVPVLIRLLAIPQFDEAAAEALGDIGVAADEAVPTLILSLTDSLATHHSFSAEAAGRALRRLSPEAAREVVPEFVKRLEREEQFKYERRLVVSAVTGIGPEAEAAVPILTKLLTEDEMSGQIATALGEIGPAARSAVPAILDRLQPGKVSGSFEWQHIVALGKIGPDAETAVPLLIQMLTAPDSARQGLEGVPSDPKSLNAWKSQAKHAANSLGQIGPASREAIPKLVVLSQHSEKTIPVPVPDEHPQRRSGFREGYPHRLSQDWAAKSLSETASEVLRQIQAPADEPRD